MAPTECLSTSWTVARSKFSFASMLNLKKICLKYIINDLYQQSIKILGQCWTNKNRCMGLSIYSIKKLQFYISKFMLKWSKKFDLAMKYKICIQLFVLSDTTKTFIELLGKINMDPMIRITWNKLAIFFPNCKHKY